MESIKRISSREAESYIELSIYDDKVCTQATAFSLSDPTDIYPARGRQASLFGTKWQEVTYYTDRVPEYLHPLEMMYGKWYEVTNEGPRRDSGDERESNTQSYL